MSTPNRPGGGSSRRRRIAGESAPGAAAGAPPRRIVKPAARRSTPAGEPTPSSEPVEGTEPTQSPEPVESTEATSSPERGSDTSATTGSAEPESETRTAPKIGRKRPAGAPAPAAVGEAATDGDGETAPAGAKPDRRAVALVAAAVAAVVIAAAGVVYGVRQWQQSSDVPAAHADAAEAAASAAETVFSYRYDRLDAYLQDARETMTPSFGEEFETISPALGDLAPQRQIQVQASTRDAAALPCGDDCSTERAEVLVFVDQARLADGATTPTVFGNRVEFSMVQRDGRWLVDDITAL